MSVGIFESQGMFVIRRRTAAGGWASMNCSSEYPNYRPLQGRFLTNDAKSAEGGNCSLSDRS